MIMQDPKWIGTSPSNPYWSADGKYLFFSWNPEHGLADSVYYITRTDPTPRKASAEFQRQERAIATGAYNTDRSAYTYSKEGDIYFMDMKHHTEKRITQTVDIEYAPAFISHKRIVFRRNQNMFAWDMDSGTTTQLTNFVKGSAPKNEKKEILNAQDKWLKEDEFANSGVLSTRKARRDSTEAAQAKIFKEKELRAIYLDDKNLSGVNISPDGRYVTYMLVKAAVNTKPTIIPNYITESGFTQDINGRTKVGGPVASSEFFVFDKLKDTVLMVRTDALPGINDLTDNEKEKHEPDTGTAKKNIRSVHIYGPSWNENGTYAVTDIRSADNKDRWLMLLDAATAKLTLLDRQRDEAWIGGPGIDPPGDNSWINAHTIWYQSENSGYSHIYTLDITTGKKQQLMRGNFEILDATLSKDKKHFYITTNEAHPGEQHYYSMHTDGTGIQKITSMPGAYNAILSPDEGIIAYLYSYSNKPWELFLQDNKQGAKPRQITFLAQSEVFKKYNWRDPEVITFKARDGENVYARLYKPAGSNPARPAVIFVHGAGYLQNAHKWWSSYFREYMFHNLLADRGYTVLDIDYRGSAGYGRNWRTGIYRHMGGKDLTDQVDGAKLLVNDYGVNPKNIGIYGGSYGGFITLMAMFTEPGTFAAGAALRSVTDWAHYNQEYTANILNEPAMDSMAYKRSSPIYFAEGLKGALLMCHGMVDANVHFQDIVRLTQRLIELKKENWELAVYPVEDHGFVEPSSWTDEYKRILKLFETNLANQ
jgi:dipeptidyl aminopeptidase/acylaminoacyl peptidase